MRLSAKVSGAPPETHPRAKPAAAKAKPKSSPPAYEAYDSYHDDGEYGEYGETSYAPPVARGKPKAKASAKAVGNAFQYDDDDDTPRPPPMPPPKKNAIQAQPKKSSGGTPSTPITPAPKKAIRPPQASAWDDGMGEEEQDDAMDGSGENGWEYEEAPPAKRAKIDSWGDSWGDSWQEHTNAKGKKGKPGGKGKGKSLSQNDPWADEWGDDAWGAVASPAKGKGKSKKDEQLYENCDGIQDGLLPIQQRMEEVVAAVCGPCPVCCIGGETGSGKSTQVPQIIFKDACDKMQEVKIAVVQPRRVAAVSLAKRVAHELGEHGPGGLVGHRIGGDSTPGFAIDFCSTGYFLQLLVNAPAELGRYSHVVLDEVHERSAESDLLCFVVRRLVSGPHKGVRIVIMSATVNMQLFSSYFSRLVDTGEKPAEVFVGKKCFPVAEYYLEELVDAFPNFRCGHEISQRIHELFPEALKANSWSKKIKIDARHVEKFNNIVVDILRCLARGGSTIVVFLPGIAEITTVWQEARLLQDNGQFEVLPLHSMIPQEEQQAVFAPPNARKTRVILATDIAESSITLPDITAIIDFGMHRRMDHGNSRSLASLVTKWISRDAAKQRAGRAGRTQPGICIRLYTQHWFEKVMELHEPPETQSMPLDRLYLQAKQLCEKLGQTSKIQRSAKAALLELVQSPDVEKISQSRMELADLGAIDLPEENARITRFGQLCTQLPLDLRLSRLIWLGVIYGCAADGVVFAAVLSTNDPFQFPAAHFARSEDDFAGWLRETTGSRLLFDGGLQSEPMMLRQLFLEWLATLHERHQPYGTWAKVNQARKKHTEQFAKMHRLAKGRMEHIVSQVVDLSLRTFHACAAGTRACKQLRDLIRLLGYSINERGDLAAVTQKELGKPKELLYGDDPIFEDNTNILRGLLASTFSDFLLLGTYSGGNDHQSWGGKWNHTHKSPKSAKELQIELLKAVSEKEVDVHHTAWYVTQKDDPIVGIEKYVDHVCGHSVAKPQVVLEGKNIVFVEFEGEKDAWPELSSKKWSGDPIGSQYQFNILNHYSSSMREVQRFKGNLSCEWTYGVHTLSHPHQIQWELMQPCYDWGGKPVRCNAFLERRNAVGFVTRTPVTDENFGMLRRVAVFAVASSLHANENSKIVYPVGVTVLQAPHIAFVLATTKYSNTMGGSRFGITPEKSLSIQGNCVDLPNGLLTQEWWEKIQKMRAAIRRELLSSLDQDEEAALERACSGIAPLVLSDAEDVQQCMCALLEDAENFHGKEAVEALEESNKTCDLVLYDPKDLPVAMQPLAPWDTIENAATKATTMQTQAQKGGFGKGGFGGKGGGFGKGGKGNWGNQSQSQIRPAWLQQFQGQLPKVSHAGSIKPAQTFRPTNGDEGVDHNEEDEQEEDKMQEEEEAKDDKMADEEQQDDKAQDEAQQEEEEADQDEGTQEGEEQAPDENEEEGAADQENDEEMGAEDGENFGEGLAAGEDEGAEDADETSETVPKISSLGLLGAGFGRKVFGAS